MTQQDFKNALHQMVKNDYGFELYNATSGIIKLSFYHLNSIYNSFYTSFYFKDKWTSPSISWQYAKENKRIARCAKKVVAFMVEYQEKHGNIEWCEKEIEYYSGLAQSVYLAKYSTEIELYTMK